MTDCSLCASFILNTIINLADVNMNRNINGQCRNFSCFYDVLDITLNIWHWIRTGREFKFIIPRWCYYFKFIVFVLLSYIFPRVLNRKKNWKEACLFEFLKFNLCGKLRINLCGSLVLLFSMFMNIVSMHNLLFY